MENTEQKTTTLLETVNNYEPNNTANISELDHFSVTEPMQEKVFKKGTPDEYKANVLIRDGKEYRVPYPVINAIKNILIKKPEITQFAVIKTGSGKEGTTYTTIPHTE